MVIDRFHRTDLDCHILQTCPDVALLLAGGLHLRREYNASCPQMLTEENRGCPRSRGFRDLGFHRKVKFG